MAWNRFRSPGGVIRLLLATGALLLVGAPGPAGPRATAQTPAFDTAAARPTPSVPPGSLDRQLVELARRTPFPRVLDRGEPVEFDGVELPRPPEERPTSGFEVAAWMIGFPAALGVGTMVVLGRRRGRARRMPGTSR